jgi:hypothetical protein
MISYIFLKIIKMSKLSLKEIFSYSSKGLESLILNYGDETRYSNKLEKRNALIIHAFNENHLIDKDMKYVETNEYDYAMKKNPSSSKELKKIIDDSILKNSISVETFLIYNTLNNKQKTNKLPPSIVRTILGYLKSWENVKLDYQIDQMFLQSMTLNNHFLATINENEGDISDEIKIYDNKTFNLIKKFEIPLDLIVVDMYFKIKMNEKYIVIYNFDNLYNSNCLFSIFDIETLKLIRTVNYNQDTYGLEIDEENIYIQYYDYNEQEIVAIFNLELMKFNEEKLILKENESCLFIKNNYAYILFYDKLRTTISMYNLKNLKIEKTVICDFYFDDIVDYDTNQNYFIILLNENNIVVYDLENLNLIKKTNFNKEEKYFKNFVINLKINSNYFFTAANRSPQISIWSLKTFKIVETIELEYNFNNENHSILVNDDHLFINILNEKILIWSPA